MSTLNLQKLQTSTTRATATKQLRELHHRNYHISSFHLTPKSVWSAKNTSPCLLQQPQKNLDTSNHPTTALIESPHNSHHVTLLIRVAMLLTAYYVLLNPVQLSNGRSDFGTQRTNAFSDP